MGLIMMKHRLFQRWSIIRNRLCGGITIVLGGARYWYDSNSDLHREDGPAVEYMDYTRYYIHGQYIEQLDDKQIYGKKRLAKLLTLL